VYRLTGTSAIDECRFRIHPAGRIESVRAIAGDGRCLHNEQYEESSLLPTVTLSDEAFVAAQEVLQASLHPPALQTVHGLLELEMMHLPNIAQSFRDDRTVSFSCVVLDITTGLTQRRVVCADHLHAHPRDTLTVYADSFAFPKALLPGASALFRNVRRHVNPMLEVHCQLQASSSVRVLSLPIVSAYLAPLVPEPAFDNVADSCLYDIQCRPHVSLSRIMCTVTTVSLLSFSLSPTNREPMAEAEVFIDDSTGEAKLVLCGSLVHALFGLSNEDLKVIKRGLQRCGVFRHDQTDGKDGRKSGRSRTTSLPHSRQQEDDYDPLLPPESPRHKVLLREKIGSITRPSYRFLVICGIKKPHMGRRWYDPRKRKPVEVKEGTREKSRKHQTWTAPRLWLEALHVQRR